MALPSKLRVTPIVEALLEMRFETSELSEIFLGRVASYPPWAEYTHVRLPMADLPAPIRNQDPQFQYQPLIELRSSDGLRLAKIGDRVLSFHALKPYPGWPKLGAEMHGAIGFALKSLKNPPITRLGLRYLNVFTAECFVDGISALNFSVAVAGQALDTPLILTYRYGEPPHAALVKIASPEFVTTPIAGVTAFVDIDVFTPEGFRASGYAEVSDWIERAHSVLKEQFFRLFSEDLNEKLVVE